MLKWFFKKRRSCYKGVGSKLYRVPCGRWANSRKGDRLLSYRIPFDYIAVEEKKLALQLNKKNYDLELRRREAQIAENRSFLQEMDQTTIDAQILNLSIIKWK